MALFCRQARQAIFSTNKAEPFSYYARYKGAGNSIGEIKRRANILTFFDQHSPLICPDLPSAVTLATINTAYSCNAKAVFALTQEGMTARLLSRLRPKMPIIALTTLKRIYHQLALNWGVIPFYAPVCESVIEGFNLLSVFALENQLVEKGDLVVVTAGTPFGTSGTTNMMIVAKVGDVLVKGPPSF